MPVFNGGTLFPEAVASLLAQTESRFVLLISDNASTDGTAVLADGFAAQDARVRVIHQASDIGPLANFNLVLRSAQSRYFVWAAHDDQWDPAFLQVSLEALEAAPTAVSAAVGVEVVDADGRLLMRHRPTAGLGDPRPVRRLRALRRLPGPATIYNVFRLSRLPPGLQYPDVFNGDAAFVFAAALEAPFVVSTRYLRTVRLLDEEEKRSGPQRRIRVPDYKATVPVLWDMVRRAPELSLAERLLADIEVLRMWCYLQRTMLAERYRRRWRARVRTR